MHYRLIVTIDKRHAQTSKKAREYVNNQLSDDSSFCGEGGRFSSPIADWFLIGGRWSGELSNKTWAKGVVKKITALEKDKDIRVAGVHYGDDKKKKEQAKVKDMEEAMYKAATPKKYKNKGLCWDRDSYNQTGYEDDAMIVDEELYKAFLKGWEGEDSGYDKKEYDNHSWKELHFVDLDGDCVDKDMIGKKWIVVVDYHT